VALSLQKYSAIPIPLRNHRRKNTAAYHCSPSHLTCLNGFPLPLPVDPQCVDSRRLNTMAECYWIGSTEPCSSPQHLDVRVDSFCSTLFSLHPMDARSLLVPAALLAPLIPTLACVEWLPPLPGIYKMFSLLPLARCFSLFPHVHSH
jgi:hypothetical protein